MKILIRILIGLVVVIAVVLGIASLRPDDFRITRSAAIAAPPAVVFAQVNDLHEWQEFSPWSKLDPNMKITYAGPRAGTGASFSWVGNSDVGEGAMTIVDSRADELVRFKLDFLKPFAATSAAEFTFKPEGGQTLVTWTMTGQNNLISKAICMFMNMDKMVGGQFEQGLATLKARSESAVKK